MRTFCKYIGIGLLVGFWFGLVAAILGQGVDFFLIPAGMVADMMIPADADNRARFFVMFVCGSTQFGLFMGFLFWTGHLIDSFRSKGKDSD